jgi:ectoine hydroxylase-related dioxygenase (phytanoyl-CoA dioxygenase family)
MKSLETTGYCIVKNFLPADVLQKFQDDYNGISDTFTNSKNKNYRVIRARIPVADYLIPVVREISITTSIKIDCFLTSAGTYFATKNINFEWHTDHEPYYLWQNNYSSVNFWIPIIKPKSKTSGLKIIPQNFWEKEYPSLFKENIKGRGANRIVTFDDKVFFINDETNEKILLDINLDEICDAPAINPGDLLILRNDVFHRTQDTIDQRVALVIRSYNQNTVLQRNILMSKNTVKQRFMDNNPIPYQSLQNFFERNYYETCTIGDYLRSSELYNIVD